MKFDFDNIFNGLKKLSPALVALSIATGFIIFAPQWLLNKLGIQNLPEFVAPIIGGVFILSTTLIITIVTFSIIKKFGNRNHFRALEKQIDRLTPEEMMRVLMMYHAPGNALSMSIQDGVTSALIAKKIIVNVTTISDGIGLYTFPFVLQPWAVNYIKKHREEYKYTFEDVEKEYNAYMKNLRWY